MITLTRFLITGAIVLLWSQNSAAQLGSTANATPTGPAAKMPADTTTKVAPSQAVITVHGVCNGSKNMTAADANGCATVITREQFENLEQALHPGAEMPATARNNLAKLYAEYVTIEAATRKAGMEDTAEFREFTNWMRVLAASEYYRRKLQEKLSNPPQEEIDAYYKQHLADYEVAHVARVLVPRENALAPNKDEFDKQALQAANTAQANLAKGLDPKEVQTNVYASLGLHEPPPVDLGKQRRKDFVAEEATEVFSLNSGEISKVQTESKSYVIYKVLSRETPSEENLKSHISAQLTQQKFTETMKALVSGAQVDLNEGYFGPPNAADTEPVRSPHTMVTH